MEAQENPGVDSEAVVESGVGEAEGPVTYRPELLLCPPSVKALWGVAPRTVLGDKWWNKRREVCYAQARYHCQACGVHKIKAVFRQHLEAHEYYNTNYETGIVTVREIIGLCHFCHNYIHHERLARMTEIGISSEFQQNRIIAHGERVLREAGFTQFRPVIPESKVAWDDWALVLDDGIEHHSQFISEAHCDRHFAAENQKALNRKKKTVTAMVSL